VERGADDGGLSDTLSDGPRDATETDGLVTVTEPRLAPGMDPQPGTRIGEYLIERRVGRGGMGTVFAAVHPVIGKRAAIKVMAWDLCREASFVERFIAEARAVNRIRHPNIVEAFSIGQLEDGRCCYAMEWLDGMSLGQRLRRSRLPLAEAIDILDQIADGLEAVHEAGIIHRDLTPGNLFLVERRGGGRAVKILDFGIAKQTGLETDGIQTHSGVILGTPAYASPEQVGGGEVDRRTDIYALGVIAHEMILGRLPFDDPPTVVVARKMTEGATPVRSLWPQVPPPLAALVDAMLAIDPAARPTLAEIRAALAGLRGGGADRPAPRTSLIGRRGAALIAGAALGIGGYLVITTLAGGQGEEARGAAPPDALPETSRAAAPPSPDAASPSLDAAPLSHDAAPLSPDAALAESTHPVDAPEPVRPRPSRRRGEPPPKPAEKPTADPDYLLVPKKLPD
jgi:tRNA A-37 threonylcarbamoyl transferase component Bud32